MSEVKISAEPRTEFGKGGARRTRRAGKVPAVLYGHGEAPRHIALPAREFAAAIRHGGKNQIFNIEITGGGTALALPKAIQRDPIKDTYEHVDLLVVRRGEKVTVEIPVHLTGEAARDTLVMVENTTLAILADAVKLPEFVEVSIAGLEAGSHVTAGDVQLPAGSELAADPGLVIAVVTGAPTAEALEGETGEAAEAVEAEATPEPADA
ncbi:50S ribosomal protein L25/general stress protein Ctc [Dactylosporangium sp. NBC_01737]|uniref:50S ribosomal protein L25/general stress protein Ctc n=1 Tax=Dactylosporangium sp. NBC_01737 TaxID=2975959 RepID=UPI002E136F6E|nr:50S ribosomal protein L25/general stress protein Ctc [Dactylosporangium sp. NBC_01737]